MCTQADCVPTLNAAYESQDYLPSQFHMNSGKEVDAHDAHGLEYIARDTVFDVLHVEDYVGNKRLDERRLIGRHESLTDECWKGE